MATIRHHARIDATPDAGRSLVVHSTDVTPEEVAGQMDGVLAEGLQGLKADFER